MNHKPKDCLLYDEEKGTCSALTELFCENEDCRFYKSKNLATKEEKKQMKEMKVK